MILFFNADDIVLIYTVKKAYNLYTFNMINTAECI